MSGSGVLDRLRARFRWLDHLVRAYQRFDAGNGGFLAAGLTYYTTLALFPVLMVGFSVFGFVLARNPRMLTAIDDYIRSQVSGPLAGELQSLITSAIGARISVGVIGVLVAAGVGLNWMSRLRQALTEIWWEHRITSPGFLRTKFSDLLAMVGTFAVSVATIALTALAHAAPTAAIRRWLGMPASSVSGWVFRGIPIVVSFLVAWLLFTWMIARLPREKVSLVNSVWAGLMAAAGFELFKELGSFYLEKVLRSPAGITFGPLLGIMVFAYVTAYLVLFCTAWAATASNAQADPRLRPVALPPPAMIAARAPLDDGLSGRQKLGAAALGAAGAMALSRLARAASRRGP
ncbi:MAG: inner membrane protein YhjD [Mycobacterium sp.]